MNNDRGRVNVIGIDDGGSAGLPPSERELIASSELLCGGARHLALFPDAGAQRFSIKSNLGELTALLQGSLGRKRIVVLASGDPCFFGIGPILSEALGRDRVRIHPRPSSVALAFARLGLAWQDATVVSVHGRPIEQAVAGALRAGTLAILTDPVHTPALMAQALLDAGMEDCNAYVCERLGGPLERIHPTRLRALVGQTFDPVNVLILQREAVPTVPAFGRPESDYEVARGQITKAEVRAVTIARLEPWRTSIAWDIGAGSGSVAIELAALMRTGVVYAVEREPGQLRLLESNMARHRVAGVRVVAGTAPAALDSLPDPDAVFVGGSGNQLAAILAIAAARLHPDGRLVANFARLESVAVWQRFAAELGWPSALAQISVSRAVSVGDGMRLAPLSPVFVASLRRPGAQDGASPGEESDG